MLEQQASTLARRIKADFPQLRVPAVPAWRSTAAARVIDCTLSLRKSYPRVVVPRVQRFTAEHPGVQSCADLRALIDSYASSAAFLDAVLDMRSEKRASMLSGVVDYLLDIQHRFDAKDEAGRLALWAQWARPGDYLAVNVRGFGLAGFQYLRMLFGADTVKPDVHIIRYASEALGAKITDVRAVYIIERAGELLGEPVRAIDVALWERGSGEKLPT
jgi:hypothetical protein